jgi:hypothetical protein
MHNDRGVLIAAVTLGKRVVVHGFTIANGEGAYSGPIYNNATLTLRHITLANSAVGSQM